MLLIPNFFLTALGSGVDSPHWYWSSTEYRGYADYVYDVRLSDGTEGWDRKDDGRLSCRPVRASLDAVLEGE